MCDHYGVFMDGKAVGSVFFRFTPYIIANLPRLESVGSKIDVNFLSHCNRG